MSLLFPPSFPFSLYGMKPDEHVTIESPTLDMI